MKNAQERFVTISYFLGRTGPAPSFAWMLDAFMGEEYSNAHLVFVCEVWKSESLLPLAAMATGLKSSTSGNCPETGVWKVQQNVSSPT